GSKILQCSSTRRAIPFIREARRRCPVKRREFVTLLGGAAAWPLTARAQQASKIAKVGVLYPGTAATLSSRLAGLREGLQAAGYREPDNIELVARAANGDPKRIAPLAMELAERKVDVMLPVSPAAVHAAHHADRASRLCCTYLCEVPGGLERSRKANWKHGRLRSADTRGLSRCSQLSRRRYDLHRS